MSSIIAFILYLIFAGLAGWLTGKIMHFEASSLVNICLGLLGGVIGGVITRAFKFKVSSFIGGFIISVLGACLLVWLYRIITG